MHLFNFLILLMLVFFFNHEINDFTPNIGSILFDVIKKLCLRRMCA